MEARTPARESGQACLLPARLPCVGVRLFPLQACLRGGHLAAGVTRASWRPAAAVQLEQLLRQQPHGEGEPDGEGEDGRWWAPFVSTLQAYCNGEGLVLLRAGACGDLIECLGRSV